MVECNKRAQVTVWPSVTNVPKSELLARRRSGGAWSWSAAPMEVHAWRRAPPVEYDASLAGSVSRFTIGPLEIKTFLLTVG